MPVYYVDDGGSAAWPYDTWAKAAKSLSALDDAVALASNDIVYIGHDHVCQYTHAANRTITGPATGAPCVIISATQGSSPPTYQASTTDQVDTSEGAYSITFDGSFALYGIRMKSGANITFSPDDNEVLRVQDCTLALGANGTVFPTANGSGYLENITVDLTADGTTDRSADVLSPVWVTHIKNLNFVNAGYRTGTVFAAASDVVLTGADFSGFTNATLCELVGTVATRSVSLHNCKTASTWALSPTGNPSLTYYYPHVSQVGCGDGSSAVGMEYRDGYGTAISSTAIYRTNGAVFEGQNTSWQITTTSVVTLDRTFPLLSANKIPPLYIYGVISSTGSKTFDLYIVNDTADLTDAEIWLEVEYKADASSNEWTLISDKATRTATPVAQTDDTTSTWNGTGPSFTYKQKLSVTATVNTTGQYRARVAVGKASIASSAYLYIDPLVTVS